MRKPFLFACDALKFIAWAVIPFLTLACYTAKTVQNKHLLQHDTIIIHATDTIQQVRWQLRTDTLRERIYERDSTSQRQQGDTIIREIWHWRESSTESSRTSMDSLQTCIKSLRDSLRASQRQDIQQEVKTQRSEPPWYERMALWGFLLLIFLFILYFSDKKRKQG